MGWFFLAPRRGHPGRGCGISPRYVAAAGALVLTLVMAIYFMVIGIIRAITALTMRFPNCGWVFLGGVVTFILGLLVKQQWPYSGLFIIGLFIGIDLIFSGWSYVMLELAAQKRGAGTLVAQPESSS